MDETPVTRQTRGSNAYGVHVSISAAQPRGEAPGFNNAGVMSRPRSRAAGRIDNDLDTTASILLRFAYLFGIECQVSIERPGKLRLDVSVVRHVEQDSHRCLEIAASFAAFSR